MEKVAPLLGPELFGDVGKLLELPQPEYYLPGGFWVLLRKLVLKGCLEDAWAVLSAHSACHRCANDFDGYEDPTLEEDRDAFGIIQSFCFLLLFREAVLISMMMDCTISMMMIMIMMTTMTMIMIMTRSGFLASHAMPTNSGTKATPPENINITFSSLITYSNPGKVNFSNLSKLIHAS